LTRYLEPGKRSDDRWASKPVTTPPGLPDRDLVEVMFAPNRVEAEMVQGLLESEGLPSMLQATGVNGPQLGIGLSPQSPQRVMVRAEHADLARRLLADTGMDEDLNVDELANAAYLDEAKRRGPRGYGVIGAYARIWFWSLAAMAVAFGVFLLARLT
jgi:Putative prokaryotic signal transducing protein